MGTGSKSRDQYTVLTVWLKKDLSGDVNSDWRLLDMLGTTVFADKRDLFWRLQFLVRVGGQDGHWARVPESDLTLGSE